MQVCAEIRKFVLPSVVKLLPELQGNWSFIIDHIAPDLSHISLATTSDFTVKLTVPLHPKTYLRSILQRDFTYNMSGKLLESLHYSRF